MKKLLLIPILIVIISCSSTKNNSLSNSSESYIFPKTGKYGYSQDNPVCVGGVMDGPKKEREYLNSLTGPNGERVAFDRKGSCCGFKTKNSPYGGGALDIYKVWYIGIKDTALLYINMYDKDVVKAPEGFIFRE